MATYATLAATLAAMAATETDPTGAEDAAKLNDALVQTRVWLGDILSLAFEDNMKLKAYAIDGAVIPAGTVRGSNPVGDVEREIDQRSIRYIDIALATITTAEIAANTIAATNIADGAITEAKIATGAFSTSKIATQAITGDKIAALAVDTANLKDSAITTPKLADQAVTTAKITQRAAAGKVLPVGTAGQLLVGGNTVDGVASCFEAKTISGVINMTADGVTTFNSDSTDATAFAIVAEVAAQGTSAGGASATTWNARGDLAKTPWSIVKDPADMINLNGTKIEFKQNGSYRIVVSAPAYSTGGHKMRMIVKKDAIAADTEIVYGTSEYSHAAGSVQTRSTLEGIVTFSGATDTLYPYITVDHFTVAAQATNGLGLFVSAVAGAGTEQYCVVSVFKLL